MHFTEFSIDGFGIFSNCVIQDLPKGLIVVSGNNECGKTTLMQFFRMVLFGPVKGNRNSYPPLAGGQHGGRIKLVMDDGREVLLERIEKKIVINDSGETSNREPSAFLLNGVDRQTYERVFAMGLDDLQGFDVLTQEGAQGRLMAAGAGLGAASVPETLKKLDKRIERLLKPGGWAQEIPKLKKELGQVRAEIVDLRKLDLEYAHVTSEQSQIERELVHKKEKRKQVNLRKNRLDQVQSAREAWVRLNHNKQESLEYEHAKQFPANGESHLVSLNAEIVKRQTDREKVEDNCLALETQREHLELDRDLVDHKTEIETLAAEREKLATAMKDSPTQFHEVKQCQETFRQRLAELGSDWNEERLLKVDTSVQARQLVQQFTREFDSAERQCDAAGSEHKTAETQYQQASNHLQSASEQIHNAEVPPVTDASELRNQRQTLRTAQSVIQRLYSTESAIALHERSVADLTRQLERVERQTSEAARLIPNWLPLTSFVVSLFVGVLFHFQTLLEPGVVSWETFGICIIAGGTLISLLFIWINRKLESQSDHAIQMREVDISELKQALETVSQQLLQENSVVESHAAKLHSLTDALDIPEEYQKDAEYLRQMENDLDKCSDLLNKWLNLQIESTRARAAHRTAENAFQAQSTDLSKSTQRLVTLRTEWKVWLTGRGFDDGLRPDQFELILKAIEAARQALEVLNSQFNRATEAKEYILEISSRIKELCVAVDVPVNVELPGVETIDLLVTRVARASKAADEYKRYTIELTSCKTDVGRRNEEIAEKQATRDKLLADANASDENEFAVQGQAHKRWKALRDQISDDQLKLATTAGNPEILKEIKVELAQHSPAQIKTELETIEDELKALEEQISSSEQRVGECTKTLKDMAIDDGLGRKLQNERSLVEQIARVTKRWGTLSVYRCLLEKAREVYERERQPQVIKSADQYLRIMVNDRYKLGSSLGEESIHLERKDLQRKTETHWSSGLSDQTYLATRLALATEFGNHSESLPLILDDVLVRFDPNRRRTTAEALLKAAEHQQIFLFSCHPQVVNEITSVWSTLPKPCVPLKAFRIADGTLTPLSTTALSSA